MGFADKLYSIDIIPRFSGCVKSAAKQLRSHTIFVANSRSVNYQSSKICFFVQKNASLNLLFRAKLVSSNLLFRDQFDILYSINKYKESKLWKDSS